MPYIPDLVPKESKIIPEYFAKQSQLATKGKISSNAVQILLGLIFLGIAICFIRYLGFALLFGLLAVLCTRAGKRWLESIGRFSLTGVARLVIYGIVIVISVPVYMAYQHLDEVDEAEREVAHQHALQFTADSLRVDSVRRQQLFAVLTNADHAAPESGLELLGKADSLVETGAEKDSAQAVYVRLNLQLIQSGLAARNYKASLASVQTLLSAVPRTPELWFYRARCYIGLDSMQLAVNDLDSAKALNFKPAGRLFEQVNPLRRHIVGHCTLCNDGSTSDATGRGACSWHGGVADWNHPIYETSRKYGD
jgi:hypothetical protein